VPRTGGEPLHSVRLREGEREIEVSGSAAFVRQLLDDLPALLGRLRAEGSARPASISMPPPPSIPAPPAVPASPAAEAAEDPEPEESPDRATNGRAPADALTRQVLAILRRNARPMGIAEIRKRLSEPVSGQQVRRVLERASEQVVNTGGRPAEYRLR
jgi:pyruvate/2-oxoglutarate dehydrogenase complex dihydrolipoamide acyltransferase (E2) component